MKHWTIGNPTRRLVDLGLDDNTVSGLHASLTRTDDGRWIIEDRNSTNGTARLASGQWVRIKQAYVLPDDRLRFGRAETTVRQLLGLPVGAPQALSGGVPWRQDLTVAFTDIRDRSNMKKCLLLVPDLIFSPEAHIMRCAFHRQPVNPFSFMVFGGLIYTMITATGMSISTFMMNPSISLGTLFQTMLKGIPAFIAPLLITLVFNMFPFRVFRRFAPRARSFDDFMRLTAVLSGMGWMLGAFLLLLAHEPPHRKEDAIVLYLLAVMLFIYQQAFNVIGYKHFWKMSYTTATLCHIVSVMAVVAAVVVMLIPLFLMIMFSGNH